jgi:hypothetical protein
MDLAKLLKRAEKFTIDNSPAILTAIGITGTLTTAYLTGKASVKAYDLLLDEDTRRHAEGESPIRSDPKAMVKVVWQEYIPAAASGLLTISAIFAANRVSTRRATAMATAYSISERAFTEYKDKVVEKIGEKKEQEVRDEVAQDQVNRNPVDESKVIITGNGDVLCYDRFAGLYFKSNMEALRKAENDVNYLILHQDYASLSDFYDLIGLPPTGVSEEVGWNTDQLLELEFSTVLSPEGQPCIAIDFNHRPIRNFDQYSC